MSEPATNEKYFKARYTAAQFINAIPGTGGNITEIAKRVGTTWSTTKKYIARHASVKQALDDECEGVLDMTVCKLVEAINRGDPWAIKFMLSTLGKKRGFTERLEVSGGDGGPIVIRYTGNADPGEL